jgi:hypothetical protein
MELGDASFYGPNLSGGRASSAAEFNQHYHVGMQAASPNSLRGTLENATPTQILESLGQIDEHLKNVDLALNTHRLTQRYGKYLEDFLAKMDIPVVDITPQNYGDFVVYAGMCRQNNGVGNWTVKLKSLRAAVIAGSKRYLMTKKLWNRGMQAVVNSKLRSLLAYRRRVLPDAAEIAAQPMKECDSYCSAMVVSSVAHSVLLTFAGTTSRTSSDLECRQRTQDSVRWRSS